jgi:hypothetical protein
VTTFFEALGGKLAERWLGLLVLPGLLLLATAWTADRLGHAHWHDLGRLTAELNRIAGQPAWRSTGPLVLALAGIVLAALGLGLTVQAAGAGVERLWLSTRPRFLVAARLRRWQAAQSAFETALLAAARAEGRGRAEGRTEGRTAGHTEGRAEGRAEGRTEGADARGGPDAGALAAEARRLDAARDRIAVAEPSHPFWLGDRLAAPELRAAHRYSLDLATAWPRLWLILPPEVRTELDTARTRLSSSARLVAWSIGYVLVGLLWWPSLIAGVVTAVVAWRQSRTAAAVLADLVDATVDLHARKLAESLGLPVAATLTPQTGAAISKLLRHGR